VIGPSEQLIGTICNDINKAYIMECRGKEAPDHLVLGPEEFLALYEVMRLISLNPVRDLIVNDLKYMGMKVLLKRSPGIDVGFYDDSVRKAARFLFEAKNPAPEPKEEQ